MAKPAPSARSPRQPGRGDDSKRRLIIAVRSACKRQSVDDDERRDIQLDLVGKASMADMTLAELGRVLDHFNRGWSGKAPNRPHLGKVRALWWSLYWLGEVSSPNDLALDAFVRRQCGIDKLRFLDHRTAPAVIEALKSWLERAGVMWFASDQIADFAASNPLFDQALADRHAVFNAVGERLQRSGDIVCRYALASRILGRALPNHWTMTARELDLAIAALGKRLRHKQEPQS